MEMILGAQLYTLRNYTQTENDLRISLDRVAKMGYRSVQVSGIGPIPPERVRALCDEFGLSIAITHTDPNRIMNDTQRVIEEHDILGCDYIGIGSMPGKYMSPEWIGYFAADFKEAARKIADSGKLFMYHNHSGEFQKFDGKLVIDILAESFAPDEMGFTLDTYWAHLGGVDVCDLMVKLGDRIPCIHLKDLAVSGSAPIMAPVMEGNLDFPKMLKTLEKLGKTKYLLVEQDTCIGSPFDCLKTSYDNLSSLGYR